MCQPPALRPSPHNVPLLEHDKANAIPTLCRINAFLHQYHHGSLSSAFPLPLYVDHSQEWYSVLDSAQCAPVIVGADPFFVDVFDGEISWDDIWKKGDIALQLYNVKEDVRGTFVQILFDDRYSVAHTFHAIRGERAVIHQFTTIHRWRTQNGSVRALLFGITRRVCPQAGALDDVPPMSCAKKRCLRLCATSVGETCHYVAHRSRTDPDAQEAIKVVFTVRICLEPTLPGNQRADVHAVFQLLAIRFLQVLGPDFLGYQTSDLSKYRNDLLRSPLFANLDGEKLANDLFCESDNPEACALLGRRKTRTETMRLVDAYGVNVEANFDIDMMLSLARSVSAGTPQSQSSGKKVTVYAIPAFVRLNADSAWDILPEVDAEPGRAWFSEIYCAARNHINKAKSTPPCFMPPNQQSRNCPIT